MDNPARTFVVRICRTGTIDKSLSHYDSYTVPFEKGQSILGILKYIYETYDPGLAFYSSCRTGKCTGCHIRVNGKPRLACTTVADGNDLLLEPMKGYPVVRDLVVDRTKGKTAK